MTDTDQQLITELAALSPLDFDRQKATAAKNLGVSITALNEAVKIERNSSASLKAKGRTISLFEPKLWPDPVNGAEILGEAADHILRHMMISEGSAFACVLWACHTFMFEDFDHSPRLCITAHTEESGKTVLMTHLVGNLVNRPQSVELMKPAPFFRLAEEHKPTFLIDECDVFVHEDMDLLAALNGGWEPHGGVIRFIGEDHEPRKFSTFTPTAMAGIELHKKLPPTTISRSLIINLERAAPGEVKQVFDRKLHLGPIQETGRKIARFIHDNRSKIRNHRPTLPDNVTNRLADKWLPFFAIAEVAGFDWPEKAKKALFAQTDLSEPSRALELLVEIQKILPDTGHIQTATLIEKICHLPDAPWAEYNFRQFDDAKKKITSRQLSNLLNNYGLKPKDVKVGGLTKKGYRSDELNTAFKRYLPFTPITSTTPLLYSRDAVLSDCQSATRDNKVADKTPLKATNNKDSSEVADESGVYPKIENFDKIGNFKCQDLYSQITDPDDLGYVLNLVKHFPGQEKLKIIERYLKENEIGIRAESNNIKKLNSGRNRANVWIREYVDQMQL